MKKKTKRPIIICFANIKGGVGKTSAAYQITGMLADRGYKILVVDVDPQGNISNSFVENDITLGLNELLLNQTTIDKVILKPYPDHKFLKNIDLLPTNVELFYIEDKDKSFKDNFTNRLSQILKPIENNYDFIIIDTNPSPSLTNSMAYCYTNYFIGVLDLSMHSVRGYTHLENIINDIKEVINPNLKTLGILINNKNRKTNFSTDMISTIKELFGDLVFKTIMSTSTKNPESQVTLKPLIEYDPRGALTAQYADLTTEIIKRLKKDGVL